MTSFSVVAGNIPLALCAGSRLFLEIQSRRRGHRRRYQLARSYAAADPERIHVGGSEGTPVAERQRASGSRSPRAPGSDRAGTSARVSGRRPRILYIRRGACRSSDDRGWQVARFGIRREDRSGAFYFRSSLRRSRRLGDRRLHWLRETLRRPLTTGKRATSMATSMKCFSEVRHARNRLRPLWPHFLWRRSR